MARHPLPQRRASRTHVHTHTRDSDSSSTPTTAHAPPPSLRTTRRPALAPISDAANRPKTRAGSGAMIKTGPRSLTKAPALGHGPGGLRKTAPAAPPAPALRKFSRADSAAGSEKSVGGKRKRSRDVESSAEEEETTAEEDGVDEEEMDEMTESDDEEEDERDGDSDADGDDHLDDEQLDFFVHRATRSALHRLLKRQLVNVHRAAGIWVDDPLLESEEEDGKNWTKEMLVDALWKWRTTRTSKQSSTSPARPPPPSSSRTSSQPRRAPAPRRQTSGASLGSSPKRRRVTTRSTSTSTPLLPLAPAPGSASTSALTSPSASPPAPNTRARRSKSMSENAAKRSGSGSSAAAAARAARFPNGLPSPAAGLARMCRGSASASTSAYASAEGSASPPATAAAAAARRTRKPAAPATAARATRRAKKAALERIANSSDVEDSGSSEEEEGEEDAMEEVQEDEEDATPRGKRRTRKAGRRGRRQSTVTASDGDDEGAGEEEEGEEGEGELEAQKSSGFEGLGAGRKMRRVRLAKRPVGEEEVVVEEEGEEEAMEEDAPDADADVSMAEGDGDLEAETVTSLRKYRKAELVKLCETRGLGAQGTKEDLVKTLLDYRERTSTSASSTSTARPPTPPPPGTFKKPAGAGRGKKGAAAAPPLLDHPSALPTRQPTPEPHAPPAAAVDEGIELDLESLGLDSREIPCEELVKKEKIGSGGFKDVYIGTYKKRECAIADIRGNLSEMDIKELQVLSKLNHPNIAKFIGVSIPADGSVPCMIVSELCRNGDLFDYIRNVPAPPLRNVLTIMLDIAKGLEYLHTRKPAAVIHRDVKSSNVLITADGRAKLNDFGLARVKQSTRSVIRSLVGTVNWQPPELWQPKPAYSFSVDIFACALVFWEIMQWHLEKKQYPWEGLNEHAIYDLVGAKKQRPSVHGLRRQWGNDVVSLVEKMWAHEPKARGTAKDVVVELERIIAALPA